ncbi:ABC transporter permease [Mycolicibacterium septicum]|uniref:ABC transporter permease n=1 Tax=Mycolicibacterium septicum TaxID=98668 RepID=A0ABW9LQR4_9MYCO
MTTGEAHLPTAPARAYRWWGVGAIACLALAGVGLIGAIASAFSSGPGWLRVLGIIAVFVLIPVGILGALYCGHKRYGAWFTNAHVSEGLIEEVAEVRNDSDGSTSYYFILTVSAAVKGGPAIRRHCTVGGDQPRPEIGQTLRFRHTTLDPDDLEDALFDSIREHR